MSKEKILLVDDDEDIVESLLDILEPYGYSIETANNGNQAMELIRSSEAQFDLVISDLYMPDCDGWGLFERLGSTGTPFRFLLMSGAGQDYEGGRESKPQSGSGPSSNLSVISKPFMPDDFVRKVQSSLKEGLDQ